jgi:hypothetical protein
MASIPIVSTLIFVIGVIVLIFNRNNHQNHKNQAQTFYVHLKTPLHRPLPINRLFTIVNTSIF